MQTAMKNAEVVNNGINVIVKTNTDENGKRFIDLDTVFGNEIVEDDFYGEGNYKLNHFSAFALCGNERYHRSMIAPELEGNIYDFYSFGGWDENSTGIADDTGKQVAGPHMYGFTQSVALTATKQAGKVGFYVEAGDVVRFMGTDFEVQFKRTDNGHPSFKQV